MQRTIDFKTINAGQYNTGPRDVLICDVDQIDQTIATTRAPSDRATPAQLAAITARNSLAARLTKGAAQ